MNSPGGIDNSVEEDISFRSIVALVYSKSKLGIAWYDELSNAVMVDGITTSPDDFEDTVTKIKAQCSPTFFLLHPSIVAHHQLLEIITSSYNSNGMLNSSHYSYQLSKSTTWQPDLARHILQTKLHVRGRYSPTKGSSYEGFQQLSSSIDLENVHAMQAVGALASFLQSKVFNLDDGKITLSSISTFTWHQYLRVDENTLRSLQIFSEDVHPNVIKGEQRGKEGFSLFSLMDRTRSLPGRQKLREWLMKPLRDIVEIRHRQEVIGMLMKTGSKELIVEVAKHLRHSHDISRLLLRIKKVEAGLLEWHKLYIALEAALNVCQLVQMFCNDEYRDEHDKVVLADVFKRVTMQTVEATLNMLHNTIDFKLSTTEGIVTVREGFDTELDRYRAVYDSLDDQLATAAKFVLEMVPTINYVSVDYFPQIGYLVTVPEQDQHLLQQSDPISTLQQQPIVPVIPVSENDETDFFHSSGSPSFGLAYNVIEDGDAATFNSTQTRSADVRKRTYSGFQFIFKQSGTCYFKHKIVEELDESIGDIRSLILDRQKTLLVTLEETVLEAETMLHELAVAIATLDAYISLATIAAEMRYTKPDMREGSVVVIKNGRHPLQELTVDNFVPNDTFIPQEKGIALITGPNSSGKSIYLKQVGIIVYLAHVGSYVPCDQAIIGITDRLFTRIASTETSASPHSAFTLDLCQINRMLQGATSKSLCLIDEFGKGTTPVDGIALLAVTIKALISKKSKALCALHFIEILNPQILQSQDMACVNCFRMDFLHSSVKDVRAYFEQEETATSLSTAARSLVEDHSAPVTVTPLYKLKLGVTSSSEGIPCARMAGVPENVLLRAENIKQAISQRKAIAAVAAHRDSNHEESNATHSNKSYLPPELENEQYRELLRMFLQDIKGPFNNDSAIAVSAISSEDGFRLFKSMMWHP